MLSEGYLSGLAYRNDIQWSYPSSNEQVAEEKEEEMEATAATSLSYSSVDETQVQNLYVSCKSSGKVISSVYSRESQHSRNPRITVLQTNPNPVYESPNLAAVELYRDTSRETYLVPPSCKSICKNYNDYRLQGARWWPLIQWQPISPLRVVFNMVLCWNHLRFLCPWRIPCPLSPATCHPPLSSGIHRTGE